jgi:hypothetical protein
MKTNFIVLLLVGVTGVGTWAQTPKPFRPSTDCIQDDLNRPAERIRQT